MGIEDILKALPHRYPMLLVDRILEVHGKERIVGLKNNTNGYCHAELFRTTTNMRALTVRKSESEPVNFGRSLNRASPILG